LVNVPLKSTEALVADLLSDPKPDDPSEV